MLLKAFVFIWVDFIISHFHFMHVLQLFLLNDFSRFFMDFNSFLVLFVGIE